MKWPGLNLQREIYNGLYDIDLAPSFHCATGNCSWPDLSTLGICTHCNNVTSHTRTTCKLGDAPSSNVCTYTTTGNLSLTAVDGTKWTLINANTSVDFNKPNMRLGMLRSDTNYPMTEESLKKLQRDVTECEIHLCVRTISNFSVRNGVRYGGTFTSAPVEFGNSGLVLPEYENQTNILNAHAPLDWPGNQSFAVNAVDIVNTFGLLGSAFTADWTLDDVMIPPSDISFLLLTTPNISQIVSNVATSLTNHIRRSPSSTEILGKAFRDETFIHVRWPWFILPASLVALAALTLQLTIIVNHRDGALLWKSSLLPLLFHGFADPLDASPEKLSSIEVRSRAVEAQLRTTGERGCRFVLS